MAAPNHRPVTWVLMASGPSMCQADADLVEQWRDGDTKKALAINNTWELAPWVDVIYACDERWWDKYYPEASRAGAALWGYSAPACKKYGLYKANLERTGGNSGYQSLRLVITEFKADRVILLGYDMQAKGRSHWHGDHPKGWPTGQNFKQWIGWLGHLGNEFPHVKIVNASRETALNCFPRVNLADALSTTP